MFRNDVSQLTNDLSKFLQDVTKNGGYKLDNGLSIGLDFGKGGSLADIVFLASSPNELSSTRERLPLCLKKKLEEFSPPIKVFNPRGASIEEDVRLSKLTGIVLNCIDPNSKIQDEMRNLPKELAEIFKNWRERGKEYLRINNTLIRNTKLQKFVNDIISHSSSESSSDNPKSFSLINLIYQLISWMPELHNDIEGLAYLELITRSIEQSSILTPSLGTINLDPTNPERERKSVEETIWNIFAPLATGGIELNEDLFETLPTDKINIMSFHQAKGLEFPLVIVDVGSDFKTNHKSQKMFRFPDDGGSSGRIEEFLRPSSQLPNDERTQQNKAFDDLIRKFFVGYSRAKDCLLLVGLNKSKKGIPNVATGTLRSEKEMWDVFSKNVKEI